MRLNRLGEDGGVAICEALRANSVLRHLDIGANGLGPLVRCPVLTVLPHAHAMEGSAPLHVHREERSYSVDPNPLSTMENSVVDKG